LTNDERTVRYDCVGKGNLVKIEDCPAAVSENEIDTITGHHAWEESKVGKT